MSEREKILRYYKATGEDDVAARLVDWAEHAIKYHRYKASDFLDPHAWSIAETVSAHFNQLTLIGNGGYEGAERIKAAFVDNDYLGSVDFGIAAIQIKWDSRYHRLSHRDVLGSLIGLGISRDIIGDIIINGSECFVVVDSSLLQFIIDNMRTIGSANVNISKLPIERIPAREQKMKEIRTTIPSLRLDVVAAVGFGTSRSRMAADIVAEKVKVNWQNAKNNSQSVKPGDVISMRGRGRIEICEVLGQTKKGRISITLKRFV